VEPVEAQLAMQRVLSFGAFPSHSLVRLEAFYAPLAQYLSESLHQSVRFGTGKSYARFRERLAAGEFDIAFVQESDYSAFARPHGYRALARSSPSRLLIFAPADSGLRNVDDLRGQRIALPPIEDDATTVALQRLRELGLEPGRDVTVVHVDHSSACLQFASTGRSQAAATSDAALQFTGARRDVDYRVLDEVAPVPAPLFVARRSFGVDEAGIVLQALLRWQGLPANHAHPVAATWMDLHAVRTVDGERDLTVGDDPTANHSRSTPLPGDRR